MSMKFRFYLGTSIRFGSDSLKKAQGEFAKLGRRALVVTGPTSGLKSGALPDAEEALKADGIEYQVFNRVENNPSLENVTEAGKMAREFKADFVIGIGGGSPLDAAKAVAVLAVNDIDPVDLFKNEFPVRPLPVVAVPTTAGTGSEVTPYSIITRKDLQTKLNFGNEETVPRLAFLDARYTVDLPRNVTVNTAIDALSHVVEGYICRRANPVSDIIVREALRIFGECILALRRNKVDYEVRERLLYASLLGGMVIAQTGTAIVHGLGYSLTYFHDLPHGQANGVLMEEYLKYNYPVAGERIDEMLRLLQMRTPEDLGRVIRELMPTNIRINETDADKYAALAMQQKSTANNIREVTHEDMKAILLRSIEHLNE